MTSTLEWWTQPTANFLINKHIEDEWTGDATSTRAPTRLKIHWLGLKDSLLKIHYLYLIN